MSDEDAEAIYNAVRPCGGLFWRELPEAQRDFLRAFAHHAAETSERIDEAWNDALAEAIDTVRLSANREEMQRELERAMRKVAA